MPFTAMSFTAQFVIRQKEYLEIRFHKPVTIRFKDNYALLYTGLDNNTVNKINLLDVIPLSEYGIKSDIRQIKQYLKG